MRPVSAFILLAIFVGMSAFPAATPTCTDGCGEEQGTGCVDCLFCAPLAAPLVLPSRLFGASAPGNLVTLWNRTRRNPVVTDPVFLKRPRPL